MARMLESIPRPKQETRIAPDRDDGASPRIPAGGRAFKVVAGTIPALALIGAGLYYFAHSRSYESTDDAFIDGHVMQVSPKISGRVDHVFVDDNQVVKKGDPVVLIDSRDYDVELKQKEAMLESVRAQGVAAQAAVEQQLSNVKSLEATLRANEADREVAEAQAHQVADDLQRTESLYAKHVVSIQELTHSQDANRSAQASLEAAKMKVLAGQSQVAEAGAQVRSYQAILQYVLSQVKASEAGVEAARLNDSYTKIFAPDAGRVTHKSAEPGDYVQVGQNLAALIPDKIWVIANFKENQLRLMRPGQPAEIKLDALGGKAFKGHVDSIQMGSGARFSLLPPENATGNYVKVVQRVPVKILLDELPDAGLPVGPGESVVPAVKVQEFHYSGIDLAVAGSMGVAWISILVWRTGRQKSGPATEMTHSGRAGLRADDGALEASR